MHLNLSVRYSALFSSRGGITRFSALSVWDVPGPLQPRRASWTCPGIKTYAPWTQADRRTRVWSVLGAAGIFLWSLLPAQARLICPPPLQEQSAAASGTGRGPPGDFPYTVAVSSGTRPPLFRTSQNVFLLSPTPPALIAVFLRAP